MTVTHCTSCQGPLTLHCGSTRCTWLKCRNTACAAEIYDVDLGSRLMSSGVVERWGEA